MKRSTWKMVNVYETIANLIKVVYEVETVPSKKDMEEIAKIEAFLYVINKLDLYDEV